MIFKFDYLKNLKIKMETIFIQFIKILKEI